VRTQAKMNVIAEGNVEVMKWLADIIDDLSTTNEKKELVPPVRIACGTRSITKALRRKGEKREVMVWLA